MLWWVIRDSLFLVVLALKHTRIFKHNPVSISALKVLSVAYVLIISCAANCLCGGLLGQWVARIKLVPVASNFADAKSASVVAATCVVCTASKNTAVDSVPFDPMRRRSTSAPRYAHAAKFATNAPRAEATSKLKNNAKGTNDVCIRL